MNKSISETAIDQVQCNQEKIHLIASVQAHGVFVAVNANDFKIQMLSENFTQLPEARMTLTGEAIDRRLSDLLGEGFGTAIIQQIKSVNLTENTRHSFECKFEGNYDIYLFRMSEKLIGVEIEPKLPAKTLEGQAPRNIEEILRDFVREMKAVDTIEAYGKIVCRFVRVLTGLDRVMLYRFVQPTWYGEVLAEDRAAATQSFLNHRFPASDIPEPARQLYLRNQVRFIFDSAAGASAIYPNVNPYSRGTVDLSDSRLRAVAPIHLEYLRNMGVTTSFSVAVTVQGKLWGLIACHSMEKTYISHAVRSWCETLSHTAALAIPLLEKAQQDREELEFKDKLETLFNEVKHSPDPVADLFRQLDRMNEIFRSSGFALVNSSGVHMVGLTPGQAAIKDLYPVLLEKMSEKKLQVFCTDNLKELLPSLTEAHLQLASGVLCIRAKTLDDGLFMWFRPELTQEVIWGGDPRKATASKNFQGKINPRLSFESWTEVIQGRSLIWKEHEQRGARFVKDFFVDVLVNQQRLIQQLSTNPKAKT